MHNLDQIRCLDIESTNICNASCPQCLRTNEHGNIPTDYNDTLDFDAIIANIPGTFWPQLELINFNGITGDNIAHPNIKDIVLETCRLAPNAVILISTNGGLRNKNWWHDFGLALANTKCKVIFGIDGLEDTHSLYRVGTDWQRVISNAKAFIEAGGRASWQMIPFAHNQHQIAQCKELSEKLGFTNFFIRSENRFPTGQTSQPVYFQKKLLHTIHASDQELTNNNNQSMQMIDSKSSIKCKSIETKWLSIYADGTVWPCCFLMGWHKSPHQNRVYDLINYHFKKILKLDFLKLNLYNNKLEEILSSDIWQNNYTDSFKTKPNPICLQQCSHDPN